MKLSLITATHHRASNLQQQALPSVLSQEIDPSNFEWIVVNDGADKRTAELVSGITAPFHIVHISMPHPGAGFGLCHARNRGLEAATGDVVAYLDDDNAITPEFAVSTLQFFERPSHVKFAMPQQLRRRDTPQRQGQSFVAPSAHCSIPALIQQDELFDSNGFAHRRGLDLRWNPEFRIFCDYEYFLQCICNYGASAFALNPVVLVNYVQTVDGIIGQSCYGAWAQELSSLCEATERYPVIEPHIERLRQLVLQWQAKGDHQINAFRVA